MGILSTFMFALLRPFRKYLLLLLAVVACWMPSLAVAQSACTALWGFTSTNQLAYFNRSTNRFVATTAALAECPGNGCNALSGSNIDGNLYFFARANGNLYKYNPSTGGSPVLVGPVPIPTSPATQTNTLGATMSPSGNLFLYATNGSFAGGGTFTPSFVVIAQISTVDAATLTSWTPVRTLANTTASLSGSGDINIDNAGIGYMISNTQPSPTYHIIDLTPGGNFGRISSTLTITNAPPSQGFAVAGVAVEPVTGATYYSTTASPDVGTYVLNRTTGVTTLLGATTTTIITDMGNCPVPPAAPSVSKAFVDSFLTGGTNNATTLTISLNNPNSAAIWLFDDFKDVLPSGMTLLNGTPSGSCVIAGNSITGTAGGNTITFAADGKIPASPGCSISFAVTASASLTPYTNTIAAGALTTTSGVNAAAATATLKVGTDFSVDKQVRLGTSNALAATATISALKTMQYVFTVTNSASGGTGSATFTDTLPTQITPVLSVSASMVGGGTCTTASAVVTSVAGTQTQVTGTLTNAPPGAVCTVTVTARGANTSGTFVNTVTLAPLATTGDAVSTNNTATATATMSSATTLTIAKTNGVNTVTYGGTTAYTLTVANLGPGAAPNALLKDPAATGLSCTSVVCGTGSVGSVCPAPGSVTIANLQGSGVPLTPTFSAGHSLTFLVTCNVTATGS